MARYIDADLLLEKLNKKIPEVAKYRYTEGFNNAIMRVRSMISSSATADVVPKSEVENVIDEFIQKVCEKYEIWTDSDEREYRYTLNLMEEAKAELKKKYTEESEC